MPRLAVLLVSVAAALQTPTGASAFVARPSVGTAPSSATALSVFGGNNKKTKTITNPLPKFDSETQRWEAPPEDEESYGPSGSLLRFGPLPFAKRLTNPDEYEQAVLKYQATEKCTRMEAQGNMDAYFDNPQDWAMQKMEERKGGYKRDYTLIDTKKVVLTLTWAVIVTPIVFSIFFDLVSGNYCVENPAANFCVFTGKIIHPGRY